MNIHIGIFMFAWALMCGCSAVFEKPITDKSITLYTPADSARTTIYSQPFYWEKVDGALHYRLQICSPDFSSIQTMLLDTIITANAFTWSFVPGEYQWRIRAENSGSQTSYQYRKLFVSQGKFEDQTMVATAPADNSISYSKTITFKWNAIHNAETYVLEIDPTTGDFSNPAQTVTTAAGTLSRDVQLNERGTFKWRMYADSAGVKSQYSTTRKIDARLDSVLLDKPASGANAGSTVSASWNLPETLTGESLSYMFYLYTSADGGKTFTTVSGYPKSSSTASLTIEDLQLKTYYWAVQVIDPDNSSVKSILTGKRKFTVNSL